MTVKSAGAVQEVPWDTVNILTPFFGRGPDPITARLLALPMLRGAWVSSVASGGTWHDISGHGNHLTYNGNPTFNYYRLVGYWDLDGTGDYFSITDAASGNDFDILGNEVYVAAAARGLTLGGWCYPTNFVQGWQDVCTKGDNTVIGDAWKAFQDAGTLRWYVASGGVQFNVAQAIPSANAWYHWVFRFVPSTSIDIFQNGVKTSNLVGIPAVLNNAAADFNIGALNGGGVVAYFFGRVSSFFVCAAALSDTIINSLYHQTKELFGH